VSVCAFTKKIETDLSPYLRSNYQLYIMGNIFSNIKLGNQNSKPLQKEDYVPFALLINQRKNVIKKSGGSYITLRTTDADMYGYSGQMDYLTNSKGVIC
jgi:hypothetical protein